MALLRDIAIGDDEDCREFGPSDGEDYGRCPDCGIEHGGGFCPEPGDLVVCACGLLHEACYCPTANGHGAVL
jgi:hypothetical protein